MSSTLDDRLSDEAVVVYCNRYTEALDAGLNELEADTFAKGSTDIAELRRLVAARCPGRLIARILAPLP